MAKDRPPHIVNLQTGGVVSGGDKHYTGLFPVAALTWIVPHNLNKEPSITIVDGAGVEMEAEVIHNTANQVTIHFNIPTAGQVHAN